MDFGVKKVSTEKDFTCLKSAIRNTKLNQHVIFLQELPHAGTFSDSTSRYLAIYSSHYTFLVDLFLLHFERYRHAMLCVLNEMGIWSNLEDNSGAVVGNGDFLSNLCKVLRYQFNLRRFAWFTPDEKGRQLLGRDCWMRRPIPHDEVSEFAVYVDYCMQSVNLVANPITQLTCDVVSGDDIMKFEAKPLIMMIANIRCELSSYKEDSWGQGGAEGAIENLVSFVDILLLFHTSRWELDDLDIKEAKDLYKCLMSLLDELKAERRYLEDISELVNMMRTLEGSVLAENDNDSAIVQSFPIIRHEGATKSSKEVIIGEIEDKGADSMIDSLSKKELKREDAEEIEIEKVDKEEIADEFLSVDESLGLGRLDDALKALVLVFKKLFSSSKFKEMLNFDVYALNFMQRLTQLVEALRASSSRGKTVERTSLFILDDCMNEKFLYAGFAKKMKELQKSLPS